MHKLIKYNDKQDKMQIFLGSIWLVKEKNDQKRSSGLELKNILWEQLPECLMEILEYAAAFQKNFPPRLSQLPRGNGFQVVLEDDELPIHMQTYKISPLEV